VGDVATVGIKLKLDDQASAALAQVRSGFSSIAGAASTFNSTMSGMMKQAASIAVGIKMGDIMSGIGSLWTDMIAGAKNHNAEIRQMAGVLAMTSKPGTGWDALMGQAEKYHHKLREVAIATGTSKTEMVGAFEAIAERSQKPPAEIARIVEQMSIASRMVPSGVGGMVSGFQALEMGIVRPRNEMVMLIRQAGLMSGSARDISRNLMTMLSPERMAKASPEIKKLHDEYSKLGKEPVMAMAEKAISIMAERAKSIPMTMGQVITSIKESKDQILETAGLPILRGLTDAIRPSLDQLRRYLSVHSKDIEAWAKDAGVKIGMYMKLAADKIQLAFEYLKTHSDDIMKALSIGANTLLAAFRFAIDNKEILLAIAGAKALAGTGAGKAVGGLASQAVVAGMGLGAKGAAGMGGAFAGMGATVGAVAGLAAFAAAIAGVAAAAYQAVKYLDESKGHISPWAALAEDNASAITEAISTMAKKSTAEVRAWTGEEELWYHERAAASIAALRASGATEAEIAVAQKRIQSDYIDHAKAMGHIAIMQETARNLERQTASDAAIAGPSTTGSWLVSEQVTMAQQVQAAYEYAAKTNNQGAMGYLANFIAGNTTVQQALFDAGGQIGLGFDALAEILEKKAPELAARLRSAGATVAGTKPVPAKISMGGGNTFNIKQDFRDQDPDRIAIVFQRDVARASMTRVQARGTVLG
jgi:hypothetical protein